MPSVLLTHAHGATIVQVEPLDIQGEATVAAASSISLPIPSRFPTTSTPQTATSPSGHIFLWCNAVNVAWEYDAKGRRIGEIVIKDGPVRRVLAAGKVDGKEMAVVHSDKGLTIWQKASSGKWDTIMELDAPSGLVGLAGDKEFKTLVALGDQEMLVYDMPSGARDSVSLAKELYREPAIALSIPPLASDRVIIASAYTVLLVKKGSDGKRVITEISPGSVAGKILAVCSVPRPALTADSTCNCAVLREGGVVSLFGLDIPDGVSQTIEFGQNLVDVAFLDGSHLIGRTADGKALVQDLRNTNRPFALEAVHPVIDISVLPIARAASDPTSRVRRSASASILGEARNAGNIGITPVAMRSDSKLNGKAVIDSSKSVRVVSAPPKTSLAPRPSSSRSTSQPVQRPPRPSSSMAHLPAIEDVEEESSGSGEARADVVHHEQSLDLAWALQARPAYVRPETVPGLETSSVEDLRREICNLQLDMLRMGRGLKNEIRNAIQPLVEELREQRETNEQQRREIERLRRGY